MLFFWESISLRFTVGRRCTGPQSAKIRGFLARNKQKRQEATKRARERIGENAVLAAVNKSFAKKDIWLNCLPLSIPTGHFWSANAEHQEKSSDAGICCPENMEVAREEPCLQSAWGLHSYLATSQLYDFGLEINPEVAIYSSVIQRQ